MKLRIKGNSLRLRISQSEMAALLDEGRIAETIHFGPQPEARLTYALAHGPAPEPICLEFQPQAITILLSTTAAQRWARSNDVGIYGDAETGEGTLALLVEKDFACLDGNDPQDADAFPNPSAGVAC
jgi:hypothetical protein